MSGASDRNRGIPGIPAGALDAITDENVRLVLRSITDGLNVRNGNKDNSFITKKELEGLHSEIKNNIGTYIQQGMGVDGLAGFNGLNGLNGLNGTNGQDGSNGGLSPGDIDGIILDLQTQIINSQLFIDLGARINWIDKPGGIFDRLSAVEVVANNATKAIIDGDTALQVSITNLGVRVGTAESAIQTETTNRVNADNAITTLRNTQYSEVTKRIGLIEQNYVTAANMAAAFASYTTTVEAKIEDRVGIVEQNMLVSSDLNDLYAKYTLKVQTNGVVSGFGLASDAGAGSSFIVRADRFAIASTSYNPDIFNIAHFTVPFIVETTSRIVNGKLLQPGVYMNNAVISNGAITNAQIGHLAVDTMELQGNAVTIPLFAKNTFNISVGANTTPFLVFEILPTEFTAVAGAMVMAQVRASNFGGATDVRIVVKMDNLTTILDRSFSQTASWTTSHVTIEGIIIQPGWHTFQLFIGNSWGSGGPWTLTDASLLVLGVKK